MFRRNNAPVGALTEFLDELVFRVDDKGRVQSLEGVPLHTRDVCEVRVRGNGLLDVGFMGNNMLIDGQIR